MILLVETLTECYDAMHATMKVNVDNAWQMDDCRQEIKHTDDIQSHGPMTDGHPSQALVSLKNNFLHQRP